ncbi:DUF5681 domain-containing protein [Rhodoblastus sp.]|uniref:DUF5681 domain-containing protein n=1 Tax=Rhodoblastus sp. TaxID=1962975 RepID=UPI003F963EA0
MALGGKRPGSGRKKGTPNKATAEIKEICRKHAPDVIAELARLATKAKSEQARVSAIKELLDRGFGKAMQPIAGDSGGDPIKTEATVIVLPSNGR